MSRIAVLLGVTTVSLLHVPTAAAALNPELDKPYHFQIVLRVAPHPQLTDVFKERLGRALQDSVQSALGDAGEVTLVDRHPLLKEIEARGLQQSLDGWKGDKNGKDRKTHFVLVELVDEIYRIQTGQFDSATGLASGVMRKAEERDREFVARTILRLIKDDFGLVGTVIDQPVNPDKVRVALKGSKLGQQLDRWVKKYDVFAVAEVRALGAGERSDRLPGALLQVVEDPEPAQTGHESVLVCRLHHRYKLRPDVLGYRCMKLGTTQAPLRFRFINEETLAPADNLQVWISQFGLGERDPVRKNTTDADGFLQDKQVYNNVAFVKVFKNNDLLAVFPVEILEDRVITCKVPSESKAGPLGDLERRKRRLLDQIIETLKVQANLNKELNEIINKSQETARERARTAAATLRSEIDNYTLERIEISRAAQNRKDFDLSAVEQRLDELKSQSKRLEQFDKDLTTSITAQPKRREMLGKLARARILFDQADIEEAIALYKEAEDAPKDVLTEAERAEVARNRQQLEKAWKIKDEAHGAAREFIFNTWTKLESAREIGKNYPQAVEAFHKCRAVGDRLTVAKLKLANDAIGVRLTERVEALQVDASDDDRIEAELIRKLGGQLAQLQKDVLEFLKVGKPAAKEAR